MLGPGNNRSVLTHILGLSASLPTTKKTMSRQTTRKERNHLFHFKSTEDEDEDEDEEELRTLLPYTTVLLLPYKTATCPSVHLD